jgi:carbamoyl-phosphate synthase large subunit
MKKILLSGLGGSLFPYLHEKLNSNYELFYVDSDNQLSKLYTNFNFFLAPPVNSDGYNEFIRNLIDKFSIDFYIPLIDEEIISAKKNIDNYKGIIVISPSLEFSELCLNKFDLMEELHRLGISSIKSNMGNNYEWNEKNIIFIKPNEGRGSRGIKKITNKEQLAAYYLLEEYKPEDILIQEYIEGQEYTIGATVNNLNQLLAISIKKVIRKRGITQIAVVESNPFLNECVKNVVNQMKPCGPINIQLFLTQDKEVKIFEINPRFSTTTIMSYAGGVDEISLFIDYYNKNYTRKPEEPKSGLTLHRRWESVFYE